MSHSYLKFAAAGLLAGSVACGPVNSVRLHGRTPPDEVTRRPGSMPGDLGGRPEEPTPRTPDIGDLPGPVVGARNTGQRQICRTSAPPRGWIAVAYVSSAGNCPPRRGVDSVATAAVLTRYADLPVGLDLEVCADQPIPAGWTLAREESLGGDQCPGAARNGGPTTKRIQRLR